MVGASFTHVSVFNIYRKTYKFMLTLAIHCYWQDNTTHTSFSGPCLFRHYTSLGSQKLTIRGIIRYATFYKKQTICGWLINQVSWNMPQNKLFAFYLHFKKRGGMSLHSGGFSSVGGRGFRSDHRQPSVPHLRSVRLVLVLVLHG
jgi:hypothetical protein